MISLMGSFGNAGASRFEGIGSPVIEAPCLRVLVLRSFLDSICFKHTPILSMVSILDAIVEYEESDEPKHSVDIVTMFTSLPALQHLQLGYEILQLLAKGDRVPRRLPTRLHHLKTLELGKLALDSLHQARVLVCLIMNSPKLQTLTLQFR
ncbi:unnamed protein product [Linum trigynum]|uniref:Uncharacterized protein n=1 Tax=Linum trigynum TaxID=586398 RepID=A0AAV2GPU4_9ROSI